MIIHNHTSVEIYINSPSAYVVSPKETAEYHDSIFDTVYILSDIGCAYITTEYSKHAFKAFGNLVVTESAHKDSNGLHEIDISEKGYCQ